MELTGVLSIAFGLGTICSTALNILLSHVSKHLKSLRQPFQLTYTLFIISLILWSTLQFTTFIVTTPQPCSVAAVFTALADQASRTAFLALILISVHRPIHNNGQRAVLFILIALRVTIGAVVVGFTRSTFMPICFPTGHAPALGITQLCFDGVLMAISVVRAWVAWRAQKQAGGLVMVVTAAAAWSISTAPFQLRAGNIFARLVPTIITLGILLALLRAYPEALLTPGEGEEENRRAGAGEFPSVGNGRMQRLASDASQPQQHRVKPDVESLSKSTFTDGRQTNSTLFRNIIGQPIVHPGTMVAWAPSLVETRFPSHAGGMANISGPMISAGVLVTNEHRRGNPGSNIASRQTAKQKRTRLDSQAYQQQEEHKREQVSMQLGTPSVVLETPRTIASFAGLPTPSDNGSRGHQRLPSKSSVGRKPSISTVQNIRGLPDVNSQQYQVPDQQRQHTGYRMSGNTYYTEDDDTTTTYSHGFPLAPAPPAAEGNIGAGGDQRVLFLHSIEYDNPELVRSLTTGGNEKAYSTGRFTPHTTGVLRRSPSAATAATLAAHREENIDESPVIPDSNGQLTPVLERKRPVPERESTRVLFPTDSPKHSRNQSTSSRKSTRSLMHSRNASSASAAITTPPLPPPDQPLPPPPPLGKIRKMAPAPLKITKGGSGLPRIPMSAVNNVAPITPGQPTPYETARAWVESMAPVRKDSGPVLVNIHSRKPSSTRTMSSSTLGQAVTSTEVFHPLPVEALQAEATAVPRERTSSRARANTGVNTEDQAHRESIVIELRESLGEDEADEDDSAPSLTTAASSSSSPKENRRQQMFPVVPQINYDNGEEDEIFSTPSPYSPNSDQFSDEVIISDFEDAIELENLQVRHQPQNFKLGDRIPAFYSSRPDKGYGGRRKPPPVPLGMVPLRQRFMRPPPPPPPPPRRRSRASIVPESGASTIIESELPAPDTADRQLQARLTLLATKPEAAPQRNSDIGSLLQQLELEANQQENQWKGMRKTLVLRDSMVSPFSDVTSLESRRQSRRSSLARLQLGLERRLSAALTTATTETTATLDTAGGWQKQLAEAQMDYLQQAPQLQQQTEMLQQELLEEEEEEEEEYEGVDLISPLRPTVYVNPTLELSPTATLLSTGDICEEILEREMGLELEPPLNSPRLWSLPRTQSNVPISHLWSGAAVYDASALPAAVAVRPKKRFDASSLPLFTARLWTRPSERRVLYHEGLWRNPRRPKSILRRRSSSKKRRVTFAQEVVTAEVTGLFEKLKRPWGSKVTTNTTTTTTIDPEVAVSPGAVRKRAQPKFSVMVSAPNSRVIPRLWTQPRRESFDMPRTMLWPSAVELTVEIMEAKPRGCRAREEEGVPATSSSALWSAGPTAACSLWAKPQKQSALWPHGVLRNSQTEALWAPTAAYANPSSSSRSGGSMEAPHSSSYKKKQKAKKQHLVAPCPAITASYAYGEVSLWRQRRGDAVRVGGGGGGLWQNPAPASAAAPRTAPVPVPVRAGAAAASSSTSALSAHSSSALSSPSWEFRSISASPTAGTSFASRSSSLKSEASPEIQPQHTTLRSSSNNTTHLWTSTTDNNNNHCRSSPSMRQQHQHQQHQPTLWTLSHAGTAKTILLTAVPVAINLKAPTNRPIPADPPKAEGSLWSLREEAKPTKPQLWKPASKSIAGLWRDAPAPDQPNQKLLWSQKAAKRTTEKTPERHEITYKPSNKLVVEVSGDMWRRRQEEQDGEKPAGWMSRCVKEVKRQVHKEHTWPDMIVRKGKLIVGSSPRQHLEEPAHQRPVLRRSHSSRTLLVETKEPEAHVKEVEVKIAGRLWTARTPAPAPPATETPKSPLWTPETASRTTTAIPERISTPVTPKKQNLDLPKVSGSLWNSQQPRDVAVKRGKVVIGSHLWGHAEPAQKPALRKSKSSVTIFAVEMTTGVRDETKVEVNVAGRLWTATMPRPEEPPLVPASPLWTKETAMRTTDAIPERVTPVPRKSSLDLPKLSGSLWNMQPRDVVVKKGKVVIGSHLWHHQSVQHAPVVRHSSSSRTLIPVAREEGERRNEVTVSVGGRLWTAKAPSPAPIAPAAPESPLWSKETARRTTDAIPERVAPVPRNTCADLPKAAGSLWDVRDVAVKKGKVVVSSGLWGQSAQPAQHSLPRRSHSSIVVVVGVEREASVVEKVEVKIGGRLWTAAMSHIPAPAPVIIDVPESPLWNKQTASRTTTAIPDRVVPAPRKMSIDLPKVHGSMWDKHLPRDVVVRKGKIVVAQNSLWSHHHHERAHAPVQRTSRSSRTIFVEPKRDEKIEKVELKVEVGGRLWSAPAPQTLPAIVADEPQSPMWTKEAAKRSTNALPERISPVVPKKIASLELPKAAGSLWDGRDIVVKKGKVVVSDNLWSKPEPIVKPVMQTSRSSRTVFAVEEEAEKVEKVEVKVGGRLWSASRSRAVSPAPIAAEAPKTPLWTPETASRTTAAIPERVVPAPRKMSVELPKATGSLWDRRSVVVRKGKVVVDGLWNHRPQTAVAHPIVKRSKSSLVVLGVKREEVEEVKEDKVGVKVGGRLWTATVPTAPVAKEDAPLWTAATAARTTLAAPVKTTPALRKESDHLPTVSGSLWSIEALQPQVKKGKIVLSTSLWSRHDQPHHAPVVRRSGSSRTLFVEPTSDEDIEKVEVKVAGRLWTASRNILPSVAVVSPDIQLWTAPPPPPPAEKPAELQLAVSEPLPRPKKQVADRSLPKAGGSLWGNRSITVKKGRIVVSENLWDHSQLAPRPVLRKTSSSRVLAVMPTEPEVQKPTWQVKVGGRLWNAEASTDVVPAISTPLWTKETAERTTSAIPERVATAPRKASIDLPKAEGSLWSGRDVTVKKGKVVVSNHLWCDHDSPVVAVRKARSSRVVVAVESREAEGVVEVNVAGRLWSALTPKNPTTTIVSNTPLWAPETASRTTTATPERVATTPRKMSLDLPKATGSLWDQQPQDVVVQKRKIIITPSGLWNERSHQHPVMRRSTSRLTLVPAPCHVKRKDVAIMVAGRLWTASRAPPPPPEHDSHDSQALWAPSAPAVVEEYEHDDAFSKYMSLPARDIVVKKTRGGAHSVVVSGGLWNHQPTTPAQERQIEITVAGRLWTAALPVAQPIERKLAAPLWTPPTAPDSTSEPVASQRLLWHRDTASRTTSAAPERGISVPRKMSVDLPKATGNLWSEAEEVPPLSRTSTVSGASSGDEDEEQTGTRGDVQCALRRMRSGRLWQPSAEVAGELEGRVIEINRKKGVVVVGQQRRDRYFSMTPQKREDVNPGFRENIRIGSLRGKLRVTAAERV